MQPDKMILHKHTNLSEWIELEALHGLYECAPPALRDLLGLQFVDIDGVHCAASSAEPSILINRCFGLGQQLVADEVVIQAILAFYQTVGVRDFFLHLTPGSEPSNIRKLLSQAGMHKSRSWMKFKRDAVRAHALNPEIRVHHIGPDLAREFAQIVSPCFGMTENAIPLLTSMVDHPHWHLYMIFDNDIPAAAGAVFYRDGVGYCDWGATHRDFRQRGYQGALLAHRVNEAAKMGANQIYTATGEEIPGDPQHSYKNILRYGFSEYYLRENWVPANSAL